MILLYNKQNNNIYATIMGRVHPAEVWKKPSILNSDMTIDDMGVLRIPFRPIFEKTIVDIKELRVVDQETGRVEEVVVGKQEKTITKDFAPDVPFAELITAFEQTTEDPHQYKVVLNDKNEVVDLVKRVDIN